MPALHSAVELRLAVPADSQAIGVFLTELSGPLFEERFPGGTAADLYHWKLFTSPLGEGMAALALHQGEIVSTVTAMPKRIWFAGRERNAFELGDFFTRQEFRRRGLFRQLMEQTLREASTRGAELIYVHPNDNAFPLLEKLGFRDMLYLTERRYPVPSAVLKRRLGAAGNLARTLGVDAIARSFAVPPLAGDAIAIEEGSRFSSEWDILWNRVAPRLSVSLTRTSDFLNWRYVDSPTPFRIWTARRGGAPCGFAVTFQSQKTGEGVIIDLFTADVEAGEAENAIAAALIRQSMLALLEDGCTSVNCWNIPQLSGGVGRLPLNELLERACPRVNPRRTRVAFYARDARLLDEAGGIWHLTMGDFDGF